MSEQETKPAQPIQYKTVYMGECIKPQDGAGSTVKEIEDARQSESPCIVFEFRDIEKAIQEGINKGLLKDVPTVALWQAMGEMVKANPDLGTFRFFLQIPEARFLACHLIHVLARSGDRIAQKLEEQIEPAIAETAEKEGKPNPMIFGVDDKEE